MVAVENIPFQRWKYAYISDHEDFLLLLAKGDMTLNIVIILFDFAEEFSLTSLFVSSMLLNRLKHLYEYTFFSKMADKEELVQRAKLAEQAER